MKKRLLSTFLALTAVCSSFVPVQAEEKENMFVNGGFEESLNNGWYRERNADYLRVKDNPHSGEYCVKNVKDYAGERYCQDFVLTPGETYTVSLWARVEKGHEDAMLGVTVRYGHITDQTWNAETGISNVALEYYQNYGQEWTQIKTTFTYDGYDRYGKKLPSNNVQFNITADPNIWKTPTLISYFDDFELIPHGNAEVEPPRFPEEYFWNEDPLPKEKQIQNKNFKDTKNNWAETTIEVLGNEGIINGTSDTTYEPQRNVTRAELITLLVNNFNIKRDGKKSGFKDVPKNSWYANAITMAKNLGLIPEKLVDNGYFYPDRELTRDEVCAIAAAYAETVGAEKQDKEISFSDSDTFGKFSDDIKTAVSFGVVNGYPDGSFGADKKITRAEIAEIVKRIVELKGRRYFYVDPKNGNDKNDGTVNEPFASIYKAQEAVIENNKNMRGNIYVLLKGGVHYMNKTLNLTAADSGTNGYNIIYTSYGDEEAVLSGGESKVLDWSLYDNEKGIYRAYVGHLNTRQMYVNGVRATRAKSEEKLEAYSVNLGQEYQAITASKWLMDLSDINNVEIVHNGTYYCNYRILIDDIKQDGENVRIKYNEKFMERSRTESNIYFNLNLWVENAMELVDHDGEWFLNKNDGYLYYIPRLWEDLNTAEITLPTTETLIDGIGKIDDSTYEPIHNLKFNNIGFKYTTGVRQFNERGGLPLCQDALLLPRLINGNSDLSLGGIEVISGAVQFKNVAYVDFEGCTFSKIGNGGLNILGGIQHTDINNNEFYDITSNAMQIGKPADVGAADEFTETFPNDKRYYKAKINITNNYIHDTAVEFLSAGAMAITNLQYSNVSYNEIFRTSYSGIHSGYGFSARPSNLFHKVSMDHNYIHKTNLIKYSMNDGGAIYHMSTAYGDPRDAKTLNGRNKISYNYCEDQGCSINNIYLDDGAGWMEISHNVFNTQRDFWPYGVLTTGNNAKCNIVTDNYLRDDTLTVAGKKQEPFTEWYERTKGVISDEDLQKPEMTIIGPHYLIDEDMSTWDEGALEIVKNAGIKPEYIDKYEEEFQDFEIVYNDYGYYSDYMNEVQYLPAVYDVKAGEVFDIEIKAKNRKGTQGYISPDRIYIYNKSPEIVEVLEDNSIKPLAPGKADLVVQILCGQNKDVVDTYPVEVYVDDELGTIPGSDNPLLYVNGTLGTVKLLTGNQTGMQLRFTTKFGRNLEPHEYTISSTNEESAYFDEDGNLIAKADGTGELVIDMIWGGNNKKVQYRRDFKITSHEMYDDFDKSQIIEVGDDFVNLDNWTYIKPGSSDIKGAA